MDLLLANLTGALRLLTGLGWPMIYFVAAFFYRRQYGQPLRRIASQNEHCIEVMGLLVPLLYMVLVWWKGSLASVRCGGAHSDLRGVPGGSQQDAAGGGRRDR